MANTPDPQLTPTPTPATSLVGQVVSGRYRIQKILGEGGMGAVYLAEHTHMRKRVALKLLHPEMSQDEEVLARFRREAEAAAHVEHPNVAAATDFGQTDDGAFFLVLEYVEGHSMRDLLDKGPVPFGRALHIARQMSYALERAHMAGIVHRDLKPENVMLVHKGEDPDFVKVLDFGIAKIEPHPTRDATQPLTRFGTILGTPEYMAPEQALGETVGPHADLYAVGVMLYEMLTGKHPFDAADRMAVLSMHIVAPVPKMTDRNPAFDVPPQIEELVRKLLEKDPKLRHANARALADAIDVVAAQCGIDLPHAISVRSFGRDSNPDISSPGVPGTSPAPPQSSRVPVSSDEPWRDNDALAKTDYGIPSIPDPKAAAAGGSPSRKLPAIVETFLDQLRAQLQIRPKVVIAIAAVVPITIFVLIIIVIASHSSSGVDASGDASAAGGGDRIGITGAARSTKASPEDLRTAAAGGPRTLEALSKEYPEDAAVRKQLAIALNEAGKMPEMLRSVRELARLDKTAIDDAIVQAVVQAAQRPDTIDDAFALLEGPLGPRGVDALMDLSTAKTVPASVRTRASKSVTRPEVRANASPATGIVLDMKAAKRCEDKHDLLERAKNDGDSRIMPTLKAFRNPRGCGFAGMRDCYSCMRKDDDLDDAIKAVEARASK